MRAVFLPADGSAPTLREVGNDSRSMSAAIGHGTYIERVRCMFTAPPGEPSFVASFVLVVDEEGLYHDQQVNALASVLYSGMVSPIVGNALLVRERWTSGGLDFADLDDDEIAWLRDVLEAEIPEAP